MAIRLGSLWCPLSLLLARSLPLCAGWLSAETGAVAAGTRVSRHAALPADYQQAGEDIIRQAAGSCGAPPGQLEIAWIPPPQSKIVVTVKGEAFLSNDEIDEDDLALLEESGEGGDWEFDDWKMEDEEGESEIMEESAADGAIDMVALARAINQAMDQDEIGIQIAEAFGIDVTTPGAPDELAGVMWKAYRGFDVICNYTDVKNGNKIKTIEGRLHGRTDETTTISTKGRLKTISNENVLSCKLPKPKKEKG